MMNLSTSLIRAVRPCLTRPLQPLQSIRWARYQAFEESFDPEELKQAREWHETFDGSKLPKGQTSYARSSGPGGQHVNKTESKAITSWPVKDLLPALPKILHRAVRESKYYTARSDSLTFQAQEHRQRAANSDENQQKLIEEVQKMYQETVPGETSTDKKKRHAEIAKSFNEGRLKQKKQLSSKKQNRRPSYD
ncbi:peptidyl-trna hydrolase domain-containing protein [Colletotrichum plurivorum]|uniref:Peptidyl-trna hydrolase domain-containing protein n=1 Tax=Colletotrichum plurivorum TaxID=2175906 RepID=A0A8H6ND67_9PEZI|nr:peptidyl-trna hydrolase domain-containing protein [Colletotrichum plurivorum]